MKIRLRSAFERNETGKGQRLGSRAAPGQLLHRHHHAGDPPPDPRERASLADVYRANLRHRAALLPVHRDQDRALSGQDPSPVLSRAGGPQHSRGLHQRHEHQPAHGGAGCHGALHPRPRNRRDAPPRLRHRVRRHRPHRAGPHARSQEVRGPLSGRPDQRDQWL